MIHQVLQCFMNKNKKLNVFVVLDVCPDEVEAWLAALQG